MATDPKLTRFIDAVLAVASDLDLTTVLQRIVEAATALAGARYGALGVIGEGRFLSQFVFTGMPPEAVDRIGHLPEGRGILGLLIDQPEPIRLRTLHDHPASYGFPPGHPPMRSFLGAPVRIRGDVYGNLYLAEKVGADEFSPEDEELVVALAAVAGAAIQNARLYQGLQRRDAWREAVLDVTTRLLAGAGEGILGVVAAHARQLTAADVANVVVPDRQEGSLRIAAADGDDSAPWVGTVFPQLGSISGDVMERGEPVRVADASSDPRAHQPVVAAGGFGPAMFAPLVASSGTFGTLVVARRSGRDEFDDDDLQLLASFSGQASVAFEYGRTQDEVRRLTVIQDRERIGRDLHDSVIQRLFATGLGLQAAARRAEDRPDVAERIQRAVDDLDDTIREIRSTIFALQSGGVGAPGLRGEILRIAGDVAPTVGFDAHVRFDGAVDAAVPPHVGDQLKLALREALTNVAKHAGASRVDVRVAVDGQHLVAVVTDDGVGLPAEAEGRGLGLVNLRARARALGGDLQVDRGPAGGGTTVRWWVPIAADGV